MIIDYRDRKDIGKTGEKVSAIGLGTWGIKDYRMAIEAFVHAVEIGIDNFDTAEIYDRQKSFSVES
jgi:diketogulonate reductase-like aldo/keto reductase